MPTLWAWPSLPRPEAHARRASAARQQMFFTFPIRCYDRYMTDERTVSERERFLLVSASTAGASAATRVRVWRKLRSLGALYLQQSVCLLPDREPVRRQEIGRASC